MEKEKVVKWPLDPEAGVFNIAHRGASGYAPENTLSAFKKAVDLGADMIELDVHQTKDGELVVLHDKNVAHTTNGQGLVEDLTLTEIKRLDAGSWFSPEYSNEKVPTLSEVFNLVRGKVGVHIEIKKGRRFYPGIEERLVSLIEKEDFLQPCIVFSFHHHYINNIKRLNPYLAVGKGIDWRIFLPWENLPLDCNALYLPWIAVNPIVIRLAHQDHLRVNVWTVNNVGLMYHMIKLGVDGILTNFPQRLNWVINEIKDSRQKMRK